MAPRVSEGCSVYEVYRRGSEHSAKNVSLSHRDVQLLSNTRTETHCVQCSNNDAYAPAEATGQRGQSCLEERRRRGACERSPNHPRACPLPQSPTCGSRQTGKRHVPVYAAICRSAGGGGGAARTQLPLRNAEQQARTCPREPSPTRSEVASSTSATFNEPPQHF